MDDGRNATAAPQDARAGTPGARSALAPGRGSRGDMAACWIAAALAALAIALSFMLEPDPAGRGTHRQLGLPPCVTVTALGAPCPFCGMTTSFCFMARGRAADAFRCNPSGPLLYLLLWLTPPFMLYWSFSRRSLLALATDWPLERPVTWLFVAVLAGWAVKLTLWWP